MKNELQDYVANVVSEYLTKESKIVVGLSGGLDSMVLTHMLDAIGYNLILANCNFKLRGEEADRDSSFVRDQSNNLWSKHTFVCTTFDTRKEARERGISDEMAARDLRFQWLRSIQETYEADAIALGHHSTDQVETILLNMLRGTGVKGLLGMDVFKDGILRPMLSLKKEDLREYAKSQHLSYVEDSTNKTSVFKRNKVRLELLPLMKEFNPSIEDSLFRSAEFWRQEHDIFTESYKVFAKKAVTRKGQRLDMPLLLKSTSPNAYLHEYLSDYNFASDIVTDILREPLSSGRRFINRDHSWEAELFRGGLYLSSNMSPCTHRLVISKNDTEKWSIGEGSIETSILSVEDVGMYEKGFVYFDADKLPEKLLIRSMDVQDIFIPMGMRGRKNVSDFLKDHGVPNVFRSYYLVMETPDEICSVLPFRVSESVKISPETTRVFRLKWEHPCHAF